MWKKLYVHYGCGMHAPKEWMNFDVSPTLKFEKIPFIGKLYTYNAKRFPKNIKYWDIIIWLPWIKKDSCDGIYCSHVLEHLSLDELIISLKNTFFMLKKGWIFRLVVPDLDYYVNKYVNNDSVMSSINFLEGIHMWRKKRKWGLKSLFFDYFDRSSHLWMWNFKWLKAQLEEVWFLNVLESKIWWSKDRMFDLVEEKWRFLDWFCIECVK